MNPELILGRKKRAPYALRRLKNAHGSGRKPANSPRSKSKANSGDEKYEYSAIALEKHLSAYRFKRSNAVPI